MEVKVLHLETHPSGRHGYLGIRLFDPPQGKALQLAFVPAGDRETVSHRNTCFENNIERQVIIL
jgi:hypothetical protein